MPLLAPAHDQKTSLVIQLFEYVFLVWIKHAT